MHSLFSLVPDTNGLQHSTAISLVTDVLKPCSFNMGCDLEVSLPWDPLFEWGKEISASKNILSANLEFDFEYSLTLNCLDVDLKKIALSHDYGQ